MVEGAWGGAGGALAVVGKGIDAWRDRTCRLRSECGRSSRHGALSVLVVPGFGLGALGSAAIAVSEFRAGAFAAAGPGTSRRRPCPVVGVVCWWPWEGRGHGGAGRDLRVEGVVRPQPTHPRVRVAILCRRALGAREGGVHVHGDPCRRPGEPCALCAR